jgi:pimeloyl-ACP methyl ester carboxylesterase
LSTHFTDVPIPDFSAALRGDYSLVPYTLSDMAADTIGLMDALGFDSVHVVGASLGGMIAQTMAIEYPSRIRSLTSMMSTSGAPSVGQPDYGALSQLVEPPSDRQGYIHWRSRSLKAIGSPAYAFDEEVAAKTAGLSWDRDHDPLSLLRQAVAVLKSGDRTSKLPGVKVPTLVIYGAADKMVDVSGGKATAAAIAGAALHIFEGMGHGLPKPLWPEMASLIAAHVQRAEESYSKRFSFRNTHQLPLEKGI